MKRCLLTALALSAWPSAALATTDDCIPLGVTATDAGLTSLVGAITTAAPALEASTEGKALLAAVGVTNKQPTDKQVTVFAPTNEAFTVALAALGSAATPEALADVLLNHVLPGPFASAAIEHTLAANDNSVGVISLLGSTLTLTTKAHDIFVQSTGIVAPGAKVLIPDVMTCAGPVHVIDKVLLPKLKAQPSHPPAMPPPVKKSPTPPPVKKPPPPPPVMKPPPPPLVKKPPPPPPVKQPPPPPPVKKPPPPPPVKKPPPPPPVKKPPPPPPVKKPPPPPPVKKPPPPPPVKQPPPPPPVVKPPPPPPVKKSPPPPPVCTSVAATATAANLTTLVEAITLAAPALPKEVLTAVMATVPSAANTMVTIFAPTNEAFAALFEMIGGIPDDVHVIADLLLNHIIKGSFSAADLVAAVTKGGGHFTAKSLLGSDLVFTLSGKDLLIQSSGLHPPGAKVIIADVKTCAATVHVIDTVLAFKKPVPPVHPRPPMPVCAVLAQTAADAGLSALVDAIVKSASAFIKTVEGRALLAALAEEHIVEASARVTVFAPNDGAFAVAAAAFGGSLPASAIPDVLLNHVVVGDLTATAILDAVGKGGGSTTVKTLAGGTLIATTVGDKLFVKSAGIAAPGALVVTADVMTCAGPVHVIDTVLLASPAPVKPPPAPVTPPKVYTPPLHY
eukprot:jgi/Ulvmu1/5853/UM025_0113.1